MDAPILLVEDNHGDIFLIREYLNMGGLRYHELLVSGSVRGIGEVLAGRTPKVALLDLSLPDSEGLDTYRSVADILPEVPIIILSGLGDQELALEIVKQGAQDYLLKGYFDEKILEKAVNYAVERNRNILQMQRSAAAYRLLFDSNPSPMWLSDPVDHRFLRVNQAAIDHYGRGREAFLGLTVLEILHEEEREQFMRSRAQAAVDRGSHSSEWRHLRKDGSVINVVAHEDAIQLDGRPCDLVVIHDITARKKEEQHLRLLQSVVEHTKDAIIITDAEPKDEPGPGIVYCNTAFTTQTGYSPEEVIGRSPRFLQGQGTDRQELDRVREALASWSPVDTELLNYDSKGRPFWVEFSIFPVADSKGRYTNWVSVQRDITKKKKRKQELHELNQSLEHKVLERTRELSHANGLLKYTNGQITDSIRYALRIQQAILLRAEAITERFPEAFCLDLPRDLVSGDFHWHHESDGIRWIAVADCTGHGVPGAMMSIIGNDLLHRAIVEEGLRDPADVLARLDSGLSKLMKQGMNETPIRDGMDVAICAIDEREMMLRFAGAQRPLWVALPKEDQVREIPGNRIAIGDLIDHKGGFTTRKIPYVPGTRIYLSSDGFYSQFGGDEDKKYMKRRFVHLLNELLRIDGIVEQGRHMEKEFHNWKRYHPQVDDVMVVGIRL
jgi:PAS domain S-box-containing protein